jgi:hypothetical protein
MTVKERSRRVRKRHQRGNPLAERVPELAPPNVAPESVP